VKDALTQVRYTFLKFQRIQSRGKEFHITLACLNIRMLDFALNAIPPQSNETTFPVNITPFEQSVPIFLSLTRAQIE
jgi:hypothetical protein